MGGKRSFFYKREKKFFWKLRSRLSPLTWWVCSNSQRRCIGRLTLWWQAFHGVTKRIYPELLGWVGKIEWCKKWERLRHSGTFTSGKRGVQFVDAAVDHFTKWAKVEALMNITTKNIEWFLWKSVFCHNIPFAFVMDNGKQFDYNSFWEWCAKLHIRNYYSSLGHP